MRGKDKESTSNDTTNFVLHDISISSKCTDGLLRLDITAVSSTVLDVDTKSLIFILPTPMSCWSCLWQFSGTLEQVTREALYGMLHTMCLHTKLSI